MGSSSAKSAAAEAPASSSSAAADAGDKRKADGDGGAETGADAPAVKKSKSAAGAASPTKSEKKGKEKVAPFSWDDFKSHAQPIEVKFGADSKHVRNAVVKQFSTGSYGWSYQGNEVFHNAPEAGGKPAVGARVGLIVTIANSKPKAKVDAEATEGGDEEDGDGDGEADGKSSGGSGGSGANESDKEYRELAKADCPFDTSAAWLEAAKSLTVKFGAAGAPASATSISPFEVSAAPKAFKTGSFGWSYHANKKVEAHDDAAHGVSSVLVRVQLNITLVNSKSPPKKAKSKGKK